MVTMNILRMLVDVSFFAAFAGLIAAGQGGTGAFWGLLLQCLCFGLSSVAGKRRWLRLICLLPMVLCWLGYRTCVADCVLMIPTGVYIFWLVWREDYALDWERQQRLFSLFWKIALPVILFGLFAGERAAVREVTIPYTMMMLVGSVFLMRALRHEPEVYSGRTYQLINGGAVLLVAAAGYAVSTKTVLDGFAAMIKAVYQGVVLPAIYLFLGIFVTVLQLVARLFGPLELVPAEGVQADGTANFDVSELLEEAGAPGTFAELLRKAIIALLVLAGLALLALFFRWLNGKSYRTGESGPERAAVRIGVAPEKKAPAAKDEPAVRSIRAQYRKFMRLCIRKGMELRPDTTSLDVDEYAQQHPGPGKVSQQIRKLYLSARYGGSADREAVRTMKDLLVQAQKENETKEETAPGRY